MSSASLTESLKSQATSLSNLTDAPKVHTVTVGRAAHQFDPDVIVASVNDSIVFEFYPSNHSVVRAEYGYPCIPYEDMVPHSAGFFSNFFAVDSILDNPPTWTIVVNTTDPMFFYCSAPGSCLNYAMVGVINPNSTTSLDLQKTLAKQADFMMSPGESFPSEILPSVSDTVPKPTAVPSQGMSDQIENKHDLRPAETAGICIGVLVFVCLFLGLLTRIYSRANQARQNQRRQASQGTKDMATPTSSQFCSQYPPYTPTLTSQFRPELARPELA